MSSWPTIAEKGKGRGLIGSRQTGGPTGRRSFKTPQRPSQSPAKAGPMNCAEFDTFILYRLASTVYVVEHVAGLCQSSLSVGGADVGRSMGLRPIRPPEEGSILQEVRVMFRLPCFVRPLSFCWSGRGGRRAAVQCRPPRGLIRNSRLSRAGSGRSDGARRSKFSRVQRFQNIGRLHFRRQCAQAEHRNDGAGDRIARRGDRASRRARPQALKDGSSVSSCRADCRSTALPKPNDNDGHLAAIASDPVRRRFGSPDSRGTTRSPQRPPSLEAFLAAKGLTPIGPPVIAQYDPPWTLWFMRRNEIMIPIGGEHSTPSDTMRYALATGCRNTGSGECLRPRWW